VLNHICLVLDALNNSLISIYFQLLVAESLYSFVIHYTFVLVKLLFFVEVLSFSNLKHSFLGFIARKLSVETQSSKHICQVERTTIEL